jgi:plastocyanin
MRIRLLFILALCLVAAACSSTSSPAPSSAAASAVASTSAAAGGTTAVSIKGFAFDPTTIQAKVGDSITWTNQDSVPHTVTLDDKSVDSGNINGSGGTFSHAFSQAGTFTYHCSIHPTMKATVTVSG